MILRGVLYTSLFLFLIINFQNCGGGKKSLGQQNSGSLVPDTDPNDPSAGESPVPMVNGVSDLNQLPALKNQWKTMSEVGAPIARSQHMAVWTGTEMVVFGGLRSDGVCVNTGGVYNPSSNTWRATTTVNAPPGVCSGNAVWTGSRMLVWGGVNTAIAQGDPNRNSQVGSLYNPVADEWTTIANPPERIRSYLSQAVWTGDKLIVANGVGGGLPGIYDPASNTWQVTANNDPLCGNLECIFGDSAWTGSEMIIFGGRADGNNLGMRMYDPNRDQWSEPPFDITSPAFRQKHSVIWTGFNIMVYGGLTLGGSLGDTHVYDPDTQVWGRLSDSETSRYDHSTSWTGRELVVFGGRTFQQGDMFVTFLGDAEIYDYATNLWKKAPGAGSPGARINHSAVWTGSSVIIWGGTTPQAANSAEFIQLNSGAILE